MSGSKRACSWEVHKQDRKKDKYYNFSIAEKASLIFHPHVYISVLEKATLPIIPPLSL
jgi:hypothetical protein